MTNNKFTEGQEVYVSDVSVEHALENKVKKIYLHTLPGNNKYKYICVGQGSEEKYKNGEDYTTTNWKYIAKIPKKVTIELTEEQLEQVKHLLNNN